MLEIGARTELEAAIVVLTPAESKRLIAKGVAARPEVKAAMTKGTLVINVGTTNAYVAEELLGVTIDQKSDFSSGVISEGELAANHAETRMVPFVVRDGQVVDMAQWEALRDFRPGDVFIKGANALDVKGDVGIMTAAHDGGSIATAWFAITGAGGHFVCPVSLGKLVPSVEEASRKCNLHRYKYTVGLPVSLLRFSNAKVVTEIDAIATLTGASVCQVAAGGVGGSEGAVALVIEGDEDTLERAFRLVVSVKGEPPVPAPRRYATMRAATLNYDPRLVTEAWQLQGRDPRFYRP